MREGFGGGPLALSRNNLHLFVWQGGNLLVPLVVTPWLARALGVEGFGVYGLAVAVTAYGVLVADWGFGLSATTAAARAADDPAALRRLFWDVLAARLMLAAGVLVMLGVGIAVAPGVRAIGPALAAGALAVVGTAATCGWLLQGLQRMGAFAAVSLGGRMLTVPLTLWLVRSPRDVVAAVAIQGAGQIVSAAASLLVARQAVALGPRAWSLSGGWRQIRDGRHLFASRLSVSLYTQANALLVGAGAGVAQAGLFAGAQRLQAACVGLLQPVTMALQPQVSRLAADEPARARRLMVRGLAGEVALGLGLGAALWVAAPWVVPGFLGPAFAGAVPAARVLALLPPVAAVTSVLGTVVLVPLGLERRLAGCLALAGMVNLGTLLVLAPRLGAVGGAACAVGTELVLAGLMAGALWRRR